MMPSRLIVLGLVTALGLAATAGCATKSDEDTTAEADESQLTLNSARYLGEIEPGATRSGVYMPPKRSSWGFTARGGDIITIGVSSPVGDAVAFLTDEDSIVLAANDDAEPGTHDAFIQYFVPASTPLRTFRIVFQDYQLLPATFSTTLLVEASPSCTYRGSVHSSGETFPSIDGCNTCTCGPRGVECSKRVCSCNPKTEPDHHYVGTPDQCLTIHYSCPANQVQFSNPCGCGCASLGASTF